MNFTLRPLGLVVVYSLLFSQPVLFAQGNGVDIGEPGFVNGPIEVLPESPEAYEPFTIEFRISEEVCCAFEHNSINIDLQDHSITLEYVGTTLTFIGAESSLVTEIQGLPPGSYTITTLVHVVGGETEGPLYTTEFTVAETSPPQIAHTLFHPGINHYFVTAGEGELAQVLEDGWYTSDRGFYVWSADSDAPAAAQPVCRFYSALVNSHFYTGREKECAKLQEEDHGWEYEGVAFLALMPTGGACPAGTDPVWRLYNNRFQHLDSNHRFVASSETYHTMIAAGWIGEGVAFCSPPVPEG